jgi:L-aspartate oxidase
VTPTDYDVVVVGGGVAGLTVASRLAAVRRVALVVSGELGDGSTRWAQGGLAAALGPDDRPAAHAADTLVAGAGGCDPDAVATVTDAAPHAIRSLIRAGAAFDRDGSGRLALTREGGHLRDRVVHAGGDATGAEVSRCLTAAVRRTDVAVIERAPVSALLASQGAEGPQVRGVVTPDADITARAVVLATGGVGGLFATSTNPSEVAGEGLGLALRAGASLVDVEFVQFHPTALRVAGGGAQVPLVTEALRGAGAVLHDAGGALIMAGHHSLADLAPRDIVARRIDEVLATGPVFLDATQLGERMLRTAFPTVYAACRGVGIDPACEPIPVGPAQHYLCGGIRTDRWGATDVEGLYAVGEVAATGLHGANRLASNSLVEGLVFGARVADRLAAGLPAPHHYPVDLSPAPDVAVGALPVLRAAMSANVGLRRSAASLGAARRVLRSALGGGSPSATAGNRWLAAAAIIEAAAARQESRGCHWRSDHPRPAEHWRSRHVVVRCDAAGLPGVVEPAALEQSA